MRTAERLWRISSDVAGVLPRAHRAVTSSPGWSPLSARGVCQLGEVVLDELALTGMTLTAPPPALERSVASCEAAADELGSLGIGGAHAEPEPLVVRGLRRHSFGRLRYERMTFEHDPRLPDSLRAEGFGGSATAVVHLCRTGTDRRPWLIWVHGAGQGQPTDLLFSRARWIQEKLGCNVALPVQVGCGVRGGAWPSYPTMDPLANVAAAMRVVSEVRALARWLRPQSSALAVAGVSMGSPVAGLVSHLEAVDAAAVFTPIHGLNAMIASHLGRWGPSVHETVELLRSDAVAQVASALDYHSVEPTAVADRRLIVGATHDQMAGREPAAVLHERWGGELHWHHGSHVGHLIAPSVQRASQSWLTALAAPDHRSDAPEVSG